MVPYQKPQNGWQAVDRFDSVPRRALLRTHAPVVEKFMRAMAEAVRIMFGDNDLTYKVLGKYLRINDRKILDGAYDEKIKVMMPP